ncbi:hypothetical protein K438DRAFT_1750402 [Mycena galopus ATCC 62051]|nr:hypothetical protein K438DRAFT_1750402 [Mycena galopus ATCC 62051]
MFAAISQKSKSCAQAREMVRFNNVHSFYDPDYRLPTFRRDDPSIFPGTAPILVTVKRKGDPQIHGQKPPKKAKASKQETNKRKKKSISTPNKQARGRWLDVVDAINRGDGKVDGVNVQCNQAQVKPSRKPRHARPPQPIQTPLRGTSHSAKPFG